MDVPQKQCKKCKTILPATRVYFYGMVTNRGGLWHHCKRCANAERMLADREKRYHNIPMRCKKCAAFFYASRTNINRAKRKGTTVQFCSRTCAGWSGIQGRGMAGKSWNGRRRGENNPCAKLKDAQVVEIKRRLRDGVRMKQVASEFNVSYGSIRSIKCGRTWSHINET